MVNHFSKLLLSSQPLLICECYRIKLALYAHFMHMNHNHGTIITGLCFIFRAASSSEVSFDIKAKCFSLLALKSVLL